MKTLFYVGVAINAVVFVAGYAANTTRALSDFHREVNWALAMFAAWILGSLLFHRAGWNGLAAAMAWLTAILLPVIAVAGFFLAGWLSETFKGPGAFR